jgi:hypothetical protein
MQQQQTRPVTVLDARREGDRQRLARLLAAIAWRLAKEQAVRSVVESDGQEQQAV